jgi:hypothetical protein
MTRDLVADLTIPAAAALLGIGKDTIYRSIERVADGTDPNALRRLSIVAVSEGKPRLITVDRALPVERPRPGRRVADVLGDEVAQSPRLAAVLAQLQAQLAAEQARSAAISQELDLRRAEVAKLHEILQGLSRTSRR